MFDQLLHRYLRLPYALHARTPHRPKRARATVVLLHGIGTSAKAWDEVVAGLPEGLNVITIDLLGFGQSPAPHWAMYSVRTQARSVIATLLKMGMLQPVILVGHSMGGLIAVEVAKRYPLLVRSLILCSPPFYNDAEARLLLPKRDRTLKRLYRFVQRHPKEFAAIVPLAIKYKLVEKAFNVTDENVDIYMAALEASIINQTSLEDAKRLAKPMQILHGALDPVVIKKNLDEVVAANSQAKLTVVLTGHPIAGAYVSAAVKAVREAAAVRTGRR